MVFHIFDLSEPDSAAFFNIPGQTKEALPLNSLNCYFETTPFKTFSLVVGFNSVEVFLELLGCFRVLNKRLFS